MSLHEAFARLRPGRSVHGISAVLLPYDSDGRIDWPAFERLLARTRDAGLDPAVNMDTGFGDLLSDAERVAVLDATRATLGRGEPFYAGAWPDPAAAATSLLPGYHAAIAAIAARGGTPVIVQSRAMHGLDAPAKAALYAEICAPAGAAIGFELGPVFAPHGEIWSDETFERMLAIPQLAGAKHSSLDRATELRRLAARDRQRPEFRVYTGNDLAIDMVAYGSDYLLGLSSFSPPAFAARDAAFARGSIDFLSLNDALQHLGNVAFRTPVPAYKHAAAMYLHLTGVLDGDGVHPRAARRPPSDRILLFDCALRIGEINDPERVFAERIEPFL
jgi:dihydrodipicolinate synthase/N-acetylneuraminate lyase